MCMSRWEELVTKAGNMGMDGINGQGIRPSQKSADGLYLSITPKHEHEKNEAAARTATLSFSTEGHNFRDFGIWR